MEKQIYLENFKIRLQEDLKEMIAQQSNELNSKL